MSGFYLPAKDLRDPKIEQATHILVKSSQGGPANSWLSMKSESFFKALAAGTPLRVSPLWETPLELPQGSLLLLYRKQGSSNAQSSGS